MAPTRRHFLQTAGMGFALGSVMAADDNPPEARRISPNDHVQVAGIGAGIMGYGDLRTAAGLEGVKVVAVCDVYKGRLVRAKEVFGKDVFTTMDYCEVLARPEIDAVIIATPDHWHAQIAIDAMKAGKDVYLQKPMVQKIDQGKPVIETAKQTGRVLQVGSQRVSSIVYHKARELVRSGAIGEVNMVEAYWDRNSAFGAWEYSIPPDASPETIDWDRFLGPAPKVPFDADRFFRWRKYWDYGTGVAGDLFVHLFSGIHLVLDAIGPTMIFASGGLRFWKEKREVPDVMMGLFEYPKTGSHPDFTLALRVNFVAGGGDSHTFRFIGSEGEMTIQGNRVTIRRSPRPPITLHNLDYYNINTWPKEIQEKFLEKYRKTAEQDLHRLHSETEETYEAPRGYSDQVHHHQNFIHAVRTRSKVIEDAVFGFRAAAPSILCNSSYREGKVYHWDPEKMEIIS